jgi:branched-chain amino acid transport system ATP-binding protein
MNVVPVAPARTPLLSIEDLHVSYGNIAAVTGIHLTIERGEIVTVIGPNGAGKSTLLKSIAGLVAPNKGRILMNGEPTEGKQPEQLVAQGLSLVPEGRHVFGSLSVEENIRVGATPRRDGKPSIQADLARVLELFPILKQRYRQRAGLLSGGEQQMLAIARALMAAPTLLLLDEPSLGLAPLVVQTVYRAIATLRSAGVTLLVVEQNVDLAFRTADRAYVLNTGRVVLKGTGAELRALPNLERHYLGAIA